MGLCERPSEDVERDDEERGRLTLEETAPTPLGTMSRGERGCDGREGEAGGGTRSPVVTSKISGLG